MNLSPSHVIVITLIIAWAAVMVAGARQATEKERMKHLERIAMIEKGIPLPPEEPPMSAVQTLMGVRQEEDRAERERKGLEFVRFIGLLAIGVGVGLWFMLMVLGRWKGGIAIGGLLVISGVSMILTTMRALRIPRDAG